MPLAKLSDIHTYVFILLFWRIIFLLCSKLLGVEQHACVKKECLLPMNQMIYYLRIIPEPFVHILLIFFASNSAIWLFLPRSLKIKLIWSRNICFEMQTLYEFQHQPYHFLITIGYIWWWPLQGNMNPEQITLLKKNIFTAVSYCLQYQ